MHGFNLQKRLLRAETQTNELSPNKKLAPAVTIFVVNVQEEVK